jgi:hypothetical protein
MPDHEKSITGSNYCGGCGQDWPCEYEQLRAENERLQAMVTQLTRERDSLRRTLGEMIGVHLPGIAASEEVCRNLPVIIARLDFGRNSIITEREREVALAEVSDALRTLLGRIA